VHPPIDVFSAVFYGLHWPLAANKPIVAIEKRSRYFQEGVPYTPLFIICVQ
jgi:hypothetical protein